MNPFHIARKEKEVIMEVIGEKGVKIGQMSEKEEKLPYHQLTERATL
jgi:hypothetical protein